MSKRKTPKLPAAVKLGKRGKGIPKNISPEEREKRRQRMIQFNQQRKKGNTKCCLK